MSRYYWCYPELEEIALGDKFIVKNYSRWSPTKFSKPVECVHFTKTQFQVENPWDKDGKPMRFTRKGNEVGGNHRIERATPELIEEIKAIQKKEANEKAKKESEANKAEMRLREKYGCEWIHDKAIQKTLSKLRSLAEQGWRELDNFFDCDTKVGEADADNPWPILNYLDWNGEEKLKTAVYYRDMATSIHEELVTICSKWSKGVAFEQNDGGYNAIKRTYLPGYGHEELVGADMLVKLHLGNRINDLTNGLFNKHREVVEHERQFLIELKDIAGHNMYRHPYLSPVKAEDEDAVDTTMID